MDISRLYWNEQLSLAVKCIGLYGWLRTVVGVVIPLWVLLYPCVGDTRKQNMQPFTEYCLDENTLWVNITPLLLILLYQVGWFSFSCILFKEGSLNDTNGLKRMVKHGSYIIGFLESVLITGGIGVCVALFLSYHNHVYEMQQPFLISFIFLLSIIGWIIALLLFFGIWTKDSRKVRVWIIFHIVLIVMGVLSFLWYILSHINPGLLSHIHPGLVFHIHPGIVSEYLFFPPIMMIVLLFDLVYSTGMVTLHFNIMGEADRMDK